MFFHITGKSVNSILSLIERTVPQIIKQFIKMRLKKAKDWQGNHSLKQDYFEKKFKISLQVPPVMN
jgi:hypothetical protein